MHELIDQTNLAIGINISEKEKIQHIFYKNEIGSDLINMEDKPINEFIQDPDNLNNSFIWKIYDSSEKTRIFMINKESFIEMLRNSIVFPCLEANNLSSDDNIIRDIQLYDFGKIFGVRILIHKDELDGILNENRDGNIFTISDKKLFTYKTKASETYLNNAAIGLEDAALSAEHCNSGGEQEQLWNIQNSKLIGYYQQKYLKYKLKYMKLKKI